MAIYVDKFCYSKMRAANLTVPITLSTLSEEDADKLLKTKVYFNLPSVDTIKSRLDNSSNHCTAIILPVIVKESSTHDVHYSAVVVPNDHQTFIAHTFPKALSYTNLIADLQRLGLHLAEVPFNNSYNKAKILVIGYTTTEVVDLINKYKKGVANEF